MNLRSSAIRALLGILLFGIISAGCSKGPSQSANTKAEQTGVKKQELSIKVPESGSLPQRVRALWATTLPIIRKDAAANLSDAEYQSRRDPLYTAWFMLQTQKDPDPKTDDQIGRLIPRILELIDHVYGFPGTPVKERIKDRKNIGRTNYIIADIEKQIKALPNK